MISDACLLVPKSLCGQFSFGNVLSAHLLSKNVTLAAIHLLSFFSFIHSFIHSCVCDVHVRAGVQRPEEGMRSLGAGVTGS
jgi:hypothetical protein